MLTALSNVHSVIMRWKMRRHLLDVIEMDQECTLSEFTVYHTYDPHPPHLCTLQVLMRAYICMYLYMNVAYIYMYVHLYEYE